MPDYLAGYADRHGFPILTDTRATRLVPYDGGLAAHTTQGILYARRVVVATGAFHVPLPPNIHRVLLRTGAAQLGVPASHRSAQGSGRAPSLGTNRKRLREAGVDFRPDYSLIDAPAATLNAGTPRHDGGRSLACPGCGSSGCPGNAPVGQRAVRRVTAVPAHLAHIPARVGNPGLSRGVRRRLLLG